MKIYGLTGGPGCGKSTVSEYIRNHTDWLILDADALCHELYSHPSPALACSMTERWGTEIISADGSVNRTILGIHVLKDQNELKLLNGLVHPALNEIVEKKIAAAPKNTVIILDAALLYEATWDKRTDAVIAVWASPAVQWERLKKRGWSDGDCMGKIQGQLPAAKKLEMADYGLISTNGPVDFLQKQCQFLIETLISIKS